MKTRRQGGDTAKKPPDPSDTSEMDDSDTENSEKVSNPPRPKAYPDGFAGPYVVFFRPISKPLNIVTISRTLSRSFNGVTSVTQVSRDKLRVVCDSLKIANEVASSEHFTREFCVYIPSRVVEITGVITAYGMTPESFLELTGEDRPMGIFKNPAVKPVRVLECRELYAASVENGTKSYKVSGSLRLTFEGTALPDYLAIGCARLPVRLFVPRIMNCLKCKQLGHTESHCSNKARCEKCGENHESQTCTVETLRCIYCNGDAPHELSTCPSYKLRAEHLKRSLQQRSKRTFAEILKQTNPPPPPKTITQNGNIYALLSPDEQVADDPNAGFPPLSQRSSRKRGNDSFSPNLPRKNPRNPQIGMDKKKENADQNPKKLPPGLSAQNYDKGNPQIPGTSKTPDTPVSLSNSQLISGLISFNDIVKGILDAFNVSDSLRIIICALIPFAKTYFKQQSLKWPLLASLVSFDE